MNKWQLYYIAMQKLRVKWAYCAGIMTGDENGNFNPKAGTTRAQAASVFMRLYK